MKIKEKLPDRDLKAPTESEPGRAHQRSGNAKLNEPRISFPHDEKCRLPSEDDQSRHRSIVENCENEHRLYQQKLLRIPTSFCNDKSYKIRTQSN